MVELHYEEEWINPETLVLELNHWRIVVNDENAAIAQAGQDIAEGRNPIAVVAADDPKRPKWDGGPRGKKYNSAEWTTLLDKATLHKRARAFGQSVR